MANSLKEVIEDITKDVNTSGGGKMKIKDFLIRFAITFPLAFITTFVSNAIVVYLWNLIAHGQGVFEWDTAFRFAIMLGITLGIVLPIVRAKMSKEK